MISIRRIEKREDPAPGEMNLPFVLGTLCIAAAAALISPITVGAAAYAELPGIRMPDHHHSIFEGDQSATPCGRYNGADALRVKLRHRDSIRRRPGAGRDSLIESCARDRSRAGAFHQRIRQKTASPGHSNFASAQRNNNNNNNNNNKKNKNSNNSSGLAGNHSTTSIIATLESGVSAGSGEYFMDVFIGTPPRHFPLILDTGSDLNWIQCLPCEDCYPQAVPVFDPATSSSYRAVGCAEPRCGLVTAAREQNCSGGSAPCEYFYWYGDRSNTTGELALETFTVNLSRAESRRVKDVVFGCGHANRGLFHGAAGLLGLGRGPLSFTSQLRAIYGHKFSYCLVDRNDNMTVSGTLVFGEDQRLKAHPDLQYTALLTNGTVDTFYYVQIAKVSVGGEFLNISSTAWQIDAEGYGGTIIDSGTTLTYFAQPAYDIIREAFRARISYPLLEDSPPLSPCYNVTGVQDVKLPEFGILFRDGALWKLPAENYFIEEDGVICLAILGTPASSLSILGNFQQQNFHVLYDVDNSRLGFAPMRCASL